MKFKTNISLYDYTLPVISYEKSFLIPKHTFLELLNLKNIESLKRSLISYYPKLREIVSPINLEQMHFILHEDFIEKVYKIIHSSPNNTIPFLMNFLLEFEIENLKTILRSKLINKTASEIEDKIHWSVEALLDNKELFNNLLKKTDLNSIFNLLNVSIYGEFIQKAAKRNQSTNSLLYINTFLDQGLIILMKRSVDNLKGIDKNIASQYLNLLTYYFNFTILFRGMSFNLEKDEIFEFLIPNSSTKLQKVFNQLLSSDDLSNVLTYIKYKDLRGISSFLNFPDSINSYLDILNQIDRNFYEKCLRLVKKISIKSPFSLNSPLTFILLKKFQFKDLIQISTGIEYNLSKDAILKRTILLQ